MEGFSSSDESDEEAGFMILKDEAISSIEKFIEPLPAAKIKSARTILKAYAFMYTNALSLSSLVSCEDLIEQLTIIFKQQGVQEENKQFNIVNSCLFSKFNDDAADLFGIVLDEDIFDFSVVDQVSDIIPNFNLVAINKEEGVTLKDKIEKFIQSSYKPELLKKHLKKGWSWFGDRTDFDILSLVESKKPFSM